jgi:hypothetical protein
MGSVFSYAYRLRADRTTDGRGHVSRQSDSRQGHSAFNICSLTNVSDGSEQELDHPTSHLRLGLSTYRLPTYTSASQCGLLP